VNAETGSLATHKPLSFVMTEEQLREEYKKRKLSPAEIEAEILKAKKAS
jgi:hypothetical protein